MRKDTHMNEETKNAMEALGMKPGDGTASVQEGEIDYKAKYEALEAKIKHMKECDDGRVKSANAELKAAKERIAELEKERALGALPQELQDVPDQIKDTALLLSQNAAKAATAGLDGRMTELEKKYARDNEARQQQLADEFVAKISNEFPDFANGLKTNGAFKAAWDQYQAFNAASIADAFKKFDYNALAYHIKRFYAENDVDPSGGREINAAPDPRAFGGGANARPFAPGKKTYTPEEWESEYDSLQNQYEDGRIGPGDYAAKRQVLMDAYKEGRVKPKQ